METRAHRPAATTPPKSVLLVEDDADLQELFATSLHTHGFRVVAIDNGLELYNWLAASLFEGTWFPDIVVSDVRLPVFSGLEALESVHRAGMHVPFVLVTAYCDDEVSEAAHRFGATLLRKPFEIDDLLRAVELSFDSFDEVTAGR